MLVQKCCVFFADAERYFGDDGKRLAALEGTQRLSGRERRKRGEDRGASRLSV